MATLGGVSVSFALHQFILESVSFGLFQVSFEFSLFLFVFTSLLFSISLFLPVSSVYRFLFGLAGNFYGFSGLLFPLISLLYLFYFFFCAKRTNDCWVNGSSRIADDSWTILEGFFATRSAPVDWFDRKAAREGIFPSGRKSPNTIQISDGKSNQNHWSCAIKLSHSLERFLLLFGKKNSRWLCSHRTVHIFSTGLFKSCSNWIRRLEYEWRIWGNVDRMFNQLYKELNCSADPLKF